MKVKITATLTLERDIDPADYEMSVSEFRDSMQEVIDDEMSDDLGPFLDAADMVVKVEEIRG